MKQLPFSTHEFQGRLRRVRQAAAAKGLDALLLTTPENIYYLTGYQTTGFYVTTQFLSVPLEAEPCFVLRYGERSNVSARSWVQHMELYRDTDDPVTTVKRVLDGARAKRVGIEMESWLLTAAVHQRLVTVAPNVKFENGSGLVDHQRLIKSSEELSYVEAAAKISSSAMKAGIDAIGEGRTDRDVAAALYSAAIQAGSEYPSDPPDAIVGPQTTLFHASWTGQSIGRGDVVMLDVTGVAGRYLAPIARCASIGTPPSYILERYELILESMDAGIAAMKPGVTCAEVYEAFAGPITKAGYEVPIKAGYSVGISFPPRRSESAGLNLLPNNHTALQPGMVIHTPRTIRVPGDQTPIFGETTLITESGHKVLTSGPRELVRK